MAIPNAIRRLTPICQWSALRKRYPSGNGQSHKNRLRWEMSIQPTPLSLTYDVRLLYSLEQSPKVFVQSPTLELWHDEPIPHRYGDGSLCLYLPGTGEWDRTMLLADTMIPWASEWLYFYELWLGTGEWCGGGHGSPKPDEVAGKNIRDLSRQRMPR